MSVERNREFDSNFGSPMNQITKDAFFVNKVSDNTPGSMSKNFDDPISPKVVNYVGSRKNSH